MTPEEQRLEAVIKNVVARGEAVMDDGAAAILHLIGRLKNVEDERDAANARIAELEAKAAALAGALAAVEWRKPVPSTLPILPASFYQDYCPACGMKESLKEGHRATCEIAGALTTDVRALAEQARLDAAVARAADRTMDYYPAGIPLGSLSELRDAVVARRAHRQARKEARDA